MSSLSIGDSNWHSALNQSVPTGEACLTCAESMFFTIVIRKQSALIKIISMGKALLMLSCRSCNQYCGRRDHSNRHNALY
jgi:hypothetical protein